MFKFNTYYKIARILFGAVISILALIAIGILVNIIVQVDYHAVFNEFKEWQHNLLESLKSGNALSETTETTVQYIHYLF